jgi:hypothetical protein
MSWQPSSHARSRDATLSSPAGARRQVSATRVLVFAVVVVLWLTFGAALLLRQESLDAAWESFRAAPLAVQAVEGVLLLPWVLGLVVWEAGWAV